MDSSNKHQQHICLSGLSIVSEHATITYDDHDLESSGNERTNDITIMPIGGTNAKVTVNGKKLVGSRSLHHNDRVIIGNNHVFRFVHPAESRATTSIESKEGTEGKEGKEGQEGKERSMVEEEEQRKKKDAKYDYAYAMREINEAAMEALTSGERAAREQAEREAKEMEAKVRALEIEMTKEKKRAEQEANAQDHHFRIQQEKLEEELKRKENELKDATFTEGRGEEELKQLKLEQQERRVAFEKKRYRYSAQCTLIFF